MLSPKRFVSLLLLFFSLSQKVHGQSYGLHALDGEPDPKPVFPTFGGAYEIKFQARIDSDAVSGQSLFEFHDGTGNNRFNLFTSGNKGLQLQLQDSNGSLRLHQWVNDNAFELGVVHEFRIGANATNAWIHRDATVLRSVSWAQTLPPIISRNSQNLGDSDLGFEPLQGVILGFQIKSDANGSVHEFMRYGNYPGQAFSPFTLSFHALFRNLTESPNQTVFELYNDDSLSDQRIAVGVELGSRIEFSIRDGTNTWSAGASEAILEDEWALWHFRVQSNGDMWIQKSGEQDSFWGGFSRNVVLTKLLRRHTSLGESHDSLNSSMIGALVGLRMQPHEGS